MKLPSKSLLIVLFLATFSFGCASTRQYVPFPDQTKTLENPNNARIYVFRPSSFGSDVPMKVYENATLVGKTGPKGCLSWEREPGTVKLVGRAENNSALQLEVKAGGTYYVQQHVRMGLLYARNHLSSLSDAEGQKLAKTCKQPKLDYSHKESAVTIGKTADSIEKPAPTIIPPSFQKI